jgi:hypothetical protein
MIDAGTTAMTAAMAVVTIVIGMMTD